MSESSQIFIVGMISMFLIGLVGGIGMARDYYRRGAEEESRQ